MSLHVRLCVCVLSLRAVICASWWVRSAGDALSQSQAGTPTTSACCSASSSRSGPQHSEPSLHYRTRRTFRARQKSEANHEPGKHSNLWTLMYFVRTHTNRWVLKYHGTQGNIISNQPSGWKLLKRCMANKRCMEFYVCLVFLSVHLSISRTIVTEHLNTRTFRLTVGLPLHQVSPRDRPSVSSVLKRPFLEKLICKYLDPQVSCSDWLLLKQSITAYSIDQCI